MSILLPKSTVTHWLGRPQTSNAASRGSAVIVVFALLMLLVALAAVNSAALKQLKREIRQIENQQAARLNSRRTPPAQPSARTNELPSRPATPAPSAGEPEPTPTTNEDAPSAQDPNTEDATEEIPVPSEFQLRGQGPND